MTALTRDPARLDRSWSLIRVLSARQFRARYRQSALELAWGLITPVVVLAVYGIVLTRVFEADGGGVPYLSLVWTGMVAWTTFATALGSGVYSIIGSADMVSKVYFPREVLPLAVVGASLVDLTIGLVVFVPLLAVQVQDVSPAVVAVGPVLVVLLVWTAGVAVLLATLAVFLRDTLHATKLLLQVGFFASPVMYPTSLLPPDLAWWASVNPLAVCMVALRDATVFHRWPDWRLLAIHAAIGCALLAGAVALCRQVEDRMVDVL